MRRRRVSAFSTEGSSSTTAIQGAAISDGYRRLGDSAVRFSRAKGLGNIGLWGNVANRGNMTPERVVHPPSASACAAACSVDGGEEGDIFQRLQQIGGGPGGLAAPARIAVVMGGDDDSWDCNALVGQMLMQFEAAHLRHLQIHD